MSANSNTREACFGARQSAAAMLRHGLRLGVIAAALIVVVSCSTTARPTVEAWQSQWERERNALPALDAFVTGDTDFCDTLDTTARVDFPQLLPTPDPVLDEAVTAWIQQAERLAFECPHSAAELDVAFRTLDILSAEVDGALMVVADR